MLELVGIGARSMLQSLTAVDSLAIQRSLTILEDRYRELREIGEKRFQAWEKESGELKEQVVAQAEALQEVKRARDAEAARAESLGEELASLTVERDGVVEEKAAALQQVQAARDAEAARAESLAEELAALMEQKQEAIEEAELTLLQLHQVQEELEHYFLNAQSAEQLATAQQDQLLRAQALMARVLPEAAAQPLVRGLEVEVLPPLTPAAGVQTEALLSSYASSLHRAASLLQRAMQR